jgi:hypothetical protein
MSQHKPAPKRRTTKVVITLDIEHVDGFDIRSLVDRVLDEGVLRDAIHDWHDEELEIDSRHPAELYEEGFEDDGINVISAIASVPSVA